MTSHRLPRHAVFAAAAYLVVGPSGAQAQTTRDASQPVQDLPGERVMEWVRESVDSWQKRDVDVVLGPEWRDAAAGRDLLEALRQTDLPLERWEPHPRFPGRLCPRTRATGQCATVSYMSHDKRTGDLLALPPSAVEAVIWVGPTNSRGLSTERMAWDAQLEVERVVLLARGYLSAER
ncbi:MAG: hypothetical protein P8188_14485 [Gemmatimonadota bacterium]